MSHSSGTIEKHRKAREWLHLPGTNKNTYLKSLPESSLRVFVREDFVQIDDDCPEVFWPSIYFWMAADGYLPRIRSSRAMQSTSASQRGPARLRGPSMEFSVYLDRGPL